MKIALLFSGGVDSAVSLKLLLDQGHEVEAFYLKIWLDDELAFLGECPWEEDLSYIRTICEENKIKYHIINLQKQYHEHVISHVIAELKQGRTPSPDIHCNQKIKFGAFFNAIDLTKFDKIASGHYAKVVEKEHKFYLKCAKDIVKDQTYFLANLTQEQLQHLIFPLGDYTKQEVRTLAENYNLLNKNRKDSQGICFLGKIKYSDFVKVHLGEKQGDIIEYESQEKKGTHNGVWFYTIGQRQGIGLHGGPWYIVKKDLAKNIIYISHKNEEKRMQDKLMVDNCHWINEELQDTNVVIKLRHGPKFIQGKVSKQNNIFEITLAEKDAGIAAGQSVIFYQNDYCLGSGVII